MCLLVAAVVLHPAESWAEQLPGMQWTPLEISLRSSSQHPWWEFPVTAVFTHASSATRIQLAGFWDGGQRYRIRFMPSLVGKWSYRTSSRDPGLAGASGTIVVREPTVPEVRDNPNLHGHLRISANGRYFEYSDGTPFFLLGDTNWAMNTARCGLGENGRGPLFQYLEDRKSKGFTAIVISFLRGFGDTKTEPAGQRNEGGYPFLGEDTSRLNAAYFQALDTRMGAIWERGLVTAGHPTWFGKSNCFFSWETAKRITSYLAVRYGHCNHLWSLSGEFQYALRGCQWTAENFDELGRALQSHNSYEDPVSIHPSGRTDWDSPFNVQSSRAFHNAGWLDHNWLQTGQSADRMFNIPVRLRENCELSPVRPALLAEGFYERLSDQDHAYHARWQAWTAWLNGAAGYGYGAVGIWQFYDPNDPDQETGKRTEGVVCWRDALDLEGARQLHHVREVISAFEWWKLRPHRAWLTVDGEENPMPRARDISPPHCAAEQGQTYIVYVPRGNAGRNIQLAHLEGKTYRARWVDPRSGATVKVARPPVGLAEWTIPTRPKPAGEDWVLLLVAAKNKDTR